MTTQEMRELDAFLAEHVMGYRRTNNPDEHTTDAATLFWHRSAGSTGAAVLVGRAYSSAELTKVYGKEMFFHSWTFYAPTIDPAAAMQVLERCAEKIKPHQGLSLVKNRTGFVLSISTPVKYEPDDYSMHAEAETLPLAICLFAKKLFEAVKE